ncbi:MAG: murein L,D-transpeptidase [Burkholderiales bacterium]|nr:murein L,D-transpeptidase [Burkholderiales bacterium]
MASLLTRLAFAAAVAALAAGCNSESGRIPARAYAPIPGDTLDLMAKKDTTRSAPILVRAYKKESELEVWKQNAQGQYVLLKTYPVCRWSGQLGPKKKEGDRQVPEGFYSVAASQMNPNSAFWLSFNVGYPNPMERAMGRSGGDIMVHGTCSSRGCFAMTNDQVEEIYAVMREAFNGGQRNVQFQSYPFRMTAENLARFRHDPNMPFWKNLKEGSDHFEVTKQEPKVDYCGQRYVFNATPDGARMNPTGPCPRLDVDDAIASAVASKARADEAKVAELVQRGMPATRIQYADGSQHPSFRQTSMAYAGNDGAPAVFTRQETRRLGEVSRPEAVAMVDEYHVDERGQRKDARPSPAAAEPAVAVAQAAPSPAAAPAPVAAPAAAPARVAAAAAAPQPAAPPAPAVAVAPPPQPGGALSAIGSLFGGRSEPTATTATTTTSVTATSAQQPGKASGSGDQPFYKRWLGLGSGGEAGAGSPPAGPASVPLPPRRQVSGTPADKVAMAPAR